MGKFTPTDIDPNLCTHIVYAYAVIDRDNLIVKPGDEWLDVEKNNIKSFIALKKINPKVKTLITIGGWVDSQQNREAYNLVFNNDKLRSAYIQSMVKFLDKYGFDGVDISFEFPQINEREGYLVWIKALKEAFDSDVNRYEVSLLNFFLKGWIRNIIISKFLLLTYFSSWCRFQPMLKKFKKAMHLNN